jgi:hypothetical protein
MAWTLQQGEEYQIEGVKDPHRFVGTDRTGDLIFIREIQSSPGRCFTTLETSRQNVLDLKGHALQLIDTNAIKGSAYYTLSTFECFRNEATTIACLFDTKNYQGIAEKLGGAEEHGKTNRNN